MRRFKHGPVNSADPRATAVEPAEASSAVRALWRAAQGDWAGAHRLVQDDPSREAAWVHAYLHREEGDDANAAYWYSRAGRSRHSGDLRTEWDAIATTLLAQGQA